MTKTTDTQASGFDAGRPTKYEIGRKLHNIVTIERTWEEAAEKFAEYLSQSVPFPIVEGNESDEAFVERMTGKCCWAGFEIKRLIRIARCSLFDTSGTGMIREALRACHDVMHECTAVLPASDCTVVAAAMSKARIALARTAIKPDAGAANDYDAGYQHGKQVGLASAELVASGFDGASDSPRNAAFQAAGLMAEVHKRDLAIAAAIRALSQPQQTEADHGAR